MLFIPHFYPLFMKTYTQFLTNHLDNFYVLVSYTKAKLRPIPGVKNLPNDWENRIAYWEESE